MSLPQRIRVFVVLIRGWLPRRLAVHEYRTNARMSLPQRIRVFVVLIRGWPPPDPTPPAPAARATRRIVRFNLALLGTQKELPKDAGCILNPRR